VLIAQKPVGMVLDTTRFAGYDPREVVAEDRHPGRLRRRYPGWEALVRNEPATP
jgi:hypothetical protein